MDKISRIIITSDKLGATSPKRNPLHQQPAQQKGQELFSVSLSDDAGHCTTDSSLIVLDLWKQLNRVTIPGDKKSYQSWKAAFTACVDNAPATAEYKLLQLRQCLAGEALKAIENLGHSVTAYHTAKERLERKFGGHRHQVALYLEEVDNFRPICPGNYKEIEKFADLLDITIVNLREANHFEELNDGLLYMKLQKKYPHPCYPRIIDGYLKNKKLKVCGSGCYRKLNFKQKL